MQENLLSSYHFDLPPELVAQRPHPGRTHSRLLVYEESTGEIRHLQFHQILEELGPGDHLVFNDSKVVACRVEGQRKSGGKCEIFFLQQKSIDHRSHHFRCLLKASGRRQLGEEILLPGNMTAYVEELPSSDKSMSEFVIRAPIDDLPAYLKAFGKIPIPPYIRKGVSDAQDEIDYQTIYANKMGSLAAPTAGLHWDQNLLNSLGPKGIRKSFISLHVGRGTFAPIKNEIISEHKMHEEEFEIDAEATKSIYADWGKLTAVGTTGLRCLESVAQNPEYFEKLKKGGPIWGATDIFMTPGHKFQSIQNLITNFHLPQSTLFILISALIGREVALEIYQVAIEKRYRFFSYGDAMCIKRKRQTS